MGVGQIRDLKSYENRFAKKKKSHREWIIKLSNENHGCLTNGRFDQRKKDGCKTNSRFE